MVTNFCSVDTLLKNNDFQKYPKIASLGLKLDPANVDVLIWNIVDMSEDPN